MPLIYYEKIAYIKNQFETKENTWVPPTHVECLRAGSPCPSSQKRQEIPLSMNLRLNLSNQEKLRNRRQYAQVYQRGQRISGPRLIIYFLPNRLKFNRLGVSVSKKNFKLSVHRHYIQRRLREVYRLEKSDLTPGYDIVISVRRRQKHEFLYTQLRQELSALVRKAKLHRPG